MAIYLNQTSDAIYEDEDNRIYFGTFLIGSLPSQLEDYFVLAQEKIGKEYEECQTYFEEEKYDLQTSMIDEFMNLPLNTLIFNWGHSLIAKLNGDETQSLDIRMPLLDKVCVGSMDLDLLMLKERIAQGDLTIRSDEDLGKVIINGNVDVEMIIFGQLLVGFKNLARDVFEYIIDEQSNFLVFIKNDKLKLNNFEGRYKSFNKFGSLQKKWLQNFYDAVNYKRNKVKDNYVGMDKIRKDMKGLSATKIDSKPDVFALSTWNNQNIIYVKDYVIKKELGSKNSGEKLNKNTASSKQFYKATECVNAEQIVLLYKILTKGGTSNKLIVYDEDHNDIETRISLAAMIKREYRELNGGSVVTLIMSKTVVLGILGGNVNSLKYKVGNMKEGYQEEDINVKKLLTDVQFPEISFLGHCAEGADLLMTPEQVYELVCLTSCDRLNLIGCNTATGELASLPDTIELNMDNMDWWEHLNEYPVGKLDKKGYSAKKDPIAEKFETLPNFAKYVHFWAGQGNNAPKIPQIFNKGPYTIESTTKREIDGPAQLAIRSPAISNKKNYAAAEKILDYMIGKKRSLAIFAFTQQANINPETGDYFNTSSYLFDTDTYNIRGDAASKEIYKQRQSWINSNLSHMNKRTTEYNIYKASTGIMYSYNAGKALIMDSKKIEDVVWENLFGFAFCPNCKGVQYFGHVCPL